MCGCPSAPPTGDPARNPGICPDWESNLRSPTLQASTQSAEPHHPGLNMYFFIKPIHSANEMTKAKLYVSTISLTGFQYISIFLETNLG